MKSLYLGLFLIPLLLTGCGKNLTGNFTGPETLSQSGGAAQTGQATLNITSDQNNAISGTFSGSAGGATSSGTFTATLADDGKSLQNVNLMLSQASPASASQQTSYPAASTCGGNYTGSLNLANDNQIAGSLSQPNSSGALSGTQNNTSYPYNGGYSGSYTGASSYGCMGGTMTLSLTKSN